MSALQVEEFIIVYCYAQEDQPFCDLLEQHLSNLKQRYHLRTWFDDQTLPGENRKEILEHKLQTADLILLLISSAFMASDDCNQDLNLALARHQKKEARVIPIHLRPVHWEGASFSEIETLPKKARPVVLWENRDAAFVDIAQGIEKVIKDLLRIRQKQEILNNTGSISSNVSQPKEVLDTPEPPFDPTLSDRMLLIHQGNMFHNQGKYQEAIHVYKQAIDFNLNAVLKNAYEGDALVGLQKAEEALALHPCSTIAHRDKVSALLELQRHEEALQVCEEFMRPNFPILAVDYNNKAYALTQLERHEEALLACAQAIRLRPNLAAAYKNKAIALNGLERYEEALLACEQAIRLRPDFTAIYALQGIALSRLKKVQDASTAFAQWSEYFVFSGYDIQHVQPHTSNT